MATKTAQVKLTLDNGQFLTATRKASTEVDAMANKGKRAGQVMSAGFNAAKGSLKSMAGGVTKLAGLAAGLAGGFSFASALKDAVGLQARFKNIAFNVNKVKGNAVEWRDIQQSIEPIALKTGKSTEDIATAFESVFKATGDLALAKTAMGIIGTTAAASGEDVQVLANAAQLMSRKFGITGDEMGEAMTRFVEKTGTGGKGIDELTGRFAVMAGEAASAGLRGKEGISTLLGILNQLDSTIGEKADPGLKAFFQTLKKGSASIASLEKKAGVKFGVDETAFDKLKKLISSKKARTAAELTFTADARTVFDTMVKPFDEAVKKAKEAGADVKGQQLAGMAAFDENMKTAGSSSMKFSQIQKEAAKRLEDPQIKMTQALEKLKVAFMQPEILDAVEDLAGSLPKVAKVFADLITFAAKNPILAGTLGIGGRVAMSFLTGMSRELIAGHTTGGKIAAAEIRGAMAGGAGGGGGGATGPGKGAMVGGAVMAGAAGFTIGMGLVDQAMGEKGSRETRGAGVGASGETALSQGSLASQQKALKQVNAELEAQKKALGEISLANVTTSIITGFAKIGQAAHLIDKDVKSPFEIAEARMEKLGELRNKLALKVKQREIMGELGISEKAPTEAANYGTRDTGGKSKGPTKVSLAPGAPRDIGVAVAGALGGKTLSVKLDQPTIDAIKGARGPLVPPKVVPGAG